MPITPPVLATPRTSSSVRLRLTLHVACTPPWLDTTGRVAISNTSATPVCDKWAMSMIIPFASIRRAMSRPKGVNPPFFRPCIDPPSSLSKKWVSPAIRKPASYNRSRLDALPSKFWRPSIVSIAPTGRRVVCRAASNLSKSSAESTAANAPFEPATASLRFAA